MRGRPTGNGKIVEEIKKDQEMDELKKQKTLTKEKNKYMGEKEGFGRV